MVILSNFQKFHIILANEKWKTNNKTGNSEFTKREKQFQEEASYAKELRDATIEDEKIITAEIIECSNLKTELERYGLSIEGDIPKIVQVIRVMKQHGYDVDKILSDYSAQEIKQIKRDLFSDQAKRLEDTKWDFRMSVLSFNPR